MESAVRLAPDGRSRESFLVACDIGTSKICVLIGEQNARGALDVIGKGAAANRGTRKGNIINVDATIEAIKRAAEEAEIMAGVQISRSWVGHLGLPRPFLQQPGRRGRRRQGPGDHARRTSPGSSTPPGASRSRRTTRSCTSCPREFAVDGQDGVADPVGMVGSRLEADVHVVTAPVAVTQNIVTCMNKAGIEVVQLVLEQFAAAEAVLTPDEKELGICLVDIGGGTTEVAVYQKGSIAHTAVIPIGGDHFTNDLAVVLRAPITDAERIKKKYGCALRQRRLRGRDGRGADGRRARAEALSAHDARRHPPAARRGAAGPRPRRHQAARPGQGDPLGASS